MRYRLPIAALAISIVTVLATSHVPIGDADPAIGSVPDSLQARPLHLLMVGLSQDMSRIAEGLWHEDFEMVRQGAYGIADHPRVTPDEMARIKAALGVQFGAFVASDQLVHDSALDLARAAKAGNMANVLEIQNRLQRACLSCHTAFRDEVRRSLY